MTEEFPRPTYTEEQIAEAAGTVLKYIKGSDSEGFFPFDVAEALDMEFWLVQDVFNRLVEQGVFERPVFEKGFCPHPSFALVFHENENLMYSIHCYECGEPMPFFCYTEEEWKALGKGKTDG